MFDIMPTNLLNTSRRLVFESVIVIILHFWLLFFCHRSVCVDNFTCTHVCFMELQVFCIYKNNLPLNCYLDCYHRYCCCCDYQCFCHHSISNSFAFVFLCSSTSYPVESFYCSYSATPHYLPIIYRLLFRIC